MNTTEIVDYEKVNTEETIRRLKRLLEYLEKKGKMNSNNEKELSDTSLSRN